VDTRGGGGRSPHVNIINFENVDKPEGGTLLSTTIYR
jgi:hypothetical protein